MIFQPRLIAILTVRLFLAFQLKQTILFFYGTRNGCDRKTNYRDTPYGSGNHDNRSANGNTLRFGNVYSAR